MKMNGVIWWDGKPILISDFYKALEIEKEKKDEQEKGKPSL